MAERLQKIIAASAGMSRRRAEELIARGDVLVNGSVATIGQTIDPDRDQIVVQGAVLPPPPAAHRYLALNKPAGFVTSLASTHGERTVIDLLPPGQRLTPVGRLDKDTSGLLLFSSDGEWANLVTHPRYGVEKEYVAAVQGRPDARALQTLREGVRLLDGTITSPAEVRVMGDDRGNTRLSIVVREGKKRQIRLMLAAVGHPVLHLRRVRIGPIALGRLGEGSWRDLEPEEVERVRIAARPRPDARGAQQAPRRRH